MSFIEELIRIIITITVMLIMARFNGPKQIAQMSFYDYISGITVGSIAATISINSNIAFPTGLFAIILFLFVSFILNKITKKNLSANMILTGEPIYLIEKGTINIEGLCKSKMTISELLSNLRYNGYFNINDVYTAMLEPTGKISVQPKGFARKTRNDDLNLKTKDPIQVLSVIQDGVMIQKNLYKMKKDERWLYRELRKQDIDAKNIKNILLAVLDENDDLTVYNRLN
ncbi:DUF421 domain-containing protein [[Eubacterium] hominis]|uniref:DUF421 domain-containing protein n=1 Tax=[Eubacterium] hominis TaxID=2764325 RepID=UPI003A4D695E